MLAELAGSVGADLEIRTLAVPDWIATSKFTMQASLLARSQS
jgi:hypothetical protein